MTPFWMISEYSSNHTGLDFMFADFVFWSRQVVLWMHYSISWPSFHYQTTNASPVSSATILTVTRTHQCQLNSMKMQLKSILIMPNSICMLTGILYAFCSILRRHSVSSVTMETIIGSLQQLHGFPPSPLLWYWANIRAGERKSQGTWGTYMHSSGSDDINKEFWSHFYVFLQIFPPLWFK